MGIDPQKIQIIRDCLEAMFHDVRQDNLSERFVFNNGKQTSELKLDRAVVDDLPFDQIKHYMETQVVPKLHENPGKVIYVGSNGLSVLERDAK
jgi:hypothetical protein